MQLCLGSGFCVPLEFPWGLCWWVDSPPTSIIKVLQMGARPLRKEKIWKWHSPFWQHPGQFVARWNLNCDWPSNKSICEWNYFVVELSVHFTYIRRRFWLLLIFFLAALFSCFRSRPDLARNLESELLKTRISYIGWRGIIQNRMKAVRVQWQNGFDQVGLGLQILPARRMPPIQATLSSSNSNLHRMFWTSCLKNFLANVTKSINSGEIPF